MEPSMMNQTKSKEGVHMKLKAVMKKFVWIVLVLLLSFLMILAGQDASNNIWIEGEPTFRYSIAMLWEILKGIAVFVPVWLLSLLGLARSFLGENWFPFAEKIPIRVTKGILSAAVILLIGIFAAEKAYSEYTTVPFWVRDRVEESFGEWQIVFVWILFYGMLLYIEQWCLRRNDSLLMIRRKQLWVTVTVFLSYLTVTCFGGVELWYIPLSHVDCPNNLEDYCLWWFSLYLAVFFVPLMLFAARKTARLFKNNAQWMTLSLIVPKKITALVALVSTGCMIVQIRESRYWKDWVETADLPEYGEVAAMGHTFQALMWSLVLFYAICLLVKQLRAAHRAKRTNNI